MLEHVATVQDDLYNSMQSACVTGLYFAMFHACGSVSALANGNTVPHLLLRAAKACLQGLTGQPCT